jgi:xylan 1,4-beta-xylosidase
LQVTHLLPGAAYRLDVYRTGYHANDAYTAYLEMGAPKDLSPKEIAHLNEITRDAAERDEILRAESDGTVKVSLTMQSNDIVLVTLRREK